ncbi:DUF3221 domain-containing protein [Paenibacillus kandeliae]|uniref:DUF3221 domain-containing protein n=1 Tax=Paenibacillus kandeliae TaxID=3231269 RepID=UPI003459D996
MRRIGMIIGMVCIMMIAGCSVYTQDTQTTRVNSVTLDDQSMSHTTPSASDNKTESSDSTSPYEADPLKSSWQYTGYVIDKKEDKIPAILFVWDVQREQVDGHSVDDILNIANPHAIWLVTDGIAQADDIRIGDAIHVILAPNVDTSFPAQGKLAQMQIVPDQPRISIQSP